MPHDHSHDHKPTNGHSHVHDHAHDHHHHHAHGALGIDIEKLQRAFIIGIVLNLTYVVVQVVVALTIGSLALLSDAGHNFLDVAGLAGSLVAMRLVRLGARPKYTYGYRKASVLIALLNGVILLVSIGAIALEAVVRLMHPAATAEVSGVTVSVVALIGIFINGVSALFLMRDKDADLNVQSAFLHLASDAVISLGIVIGGIIIYYTHWFWLDAALSLALCGVIIAGTYSLLSKSLRLSLDGIPEGINIDEVRRVIATNIEVLDVHHVHIWALSTTENALTAHIRVAENITPHDSETLKAQIKHQLEHLSIRHATLELELSDNHCLEC